ncbi:MAG: beta-lactamase family protein [Gemmatimonadetes bacterium]|nr:beta-lactamase family protein [Gemmatimonadota bacterium]
MRPPSRFSPIVAACGCVALAAAGRPPAQTAGGLASARATNRFAPARAFILGYMQERRLPSVAVAVAKDGEILWEEGFGWADLEHRIPVTPNAPHSLASISKPMTATAIMELAQEDRLELDRPANDYLGSGKLTGLAGDASG